MKYSSPLQEARLIRRYKRFLADVELPDKSRMTVHCPNTGSMKNCAQPGSRIWYSKSANPKRKYPHTFELVEVEDGVVAGINTGHANTLVREALESCRVPELSGYGEIKAEVKYGQENSRIDFLLGGHPQRPGQDCYIEVKSVTLGMPGGLGLFPDAVTDRGARHLRELIEVSRSGQRAVLFFCVQHTGIRQVRPADEIDPVYGETLRKAKDAGVEVLAYGTSISPLQISLKQKLPVVLHPG